MLNGVQILRDLVLIQPMNQKRRGSGGFALPEETGGDLGKIVAVGPDVSADLVGNIAYFGNESKQITIKGTEYIVMEINNVIGIEKETTSDEERI